MLRNAYFIFGANTTNTAIQTTLFKMDRTGGSIVYFDDEVAAQLYADMLNAEQESSNECR